MVDVTYQMVLSTLQTASIMLGIIYYLVIMRNNQKTRMIDMVSRRTEQVNNFDYQMMVRTVGRASLEWSTPEEYYAKYSVEKTPEFSVSRAIIQNNLNNWGFLFKEGIIDEDFIDRLYHPWHIINFWETYGVLLLQEREEAGVPALFSDLEYLYNAIKKRHPHLSAETRFSFQGLPME
jgi:hypothetical protein